MCYNTIEKHNTHFRTYFNIFHSSDNDCCKENPVRIYFDKTSTNAYKFQAVLFSTTITNGLTNKYIGK